MWSKDFLKGHGHWFSSVLPRSKGTVCFCSSEKCIPTHSLLQICKRLYFFPKIGKKTKYSFILFFLKLFCTLSIQLYWRSSYKIKVKSCHCSTPFYPYLCCIFFLNDFYFFPVFSWKLFKPHSLTRFKRLYLFPIQVFYSLTRLWVKMPQK